MRPPITELFVINAFDATAQAIVSCSIVDTFDFEQTEKPVHRSVVIPYA